MEQNKQPTTIIFPDGQTVKKVVDLLTRTKPPGWSRRSYASYYKEEYALWLKKDLDDMIARRCDKVYRYANFPSVSKGSLYLRLNQATKFILDEMDKDLVYEKLFRQIKVKREVDGITLRFDSVIEGMDRAEDLVPASEKPKWLLKMSNWLEDETQLQPFKTGLLLSPQEMENLEQELIGLENIIYNITSKDVTIIKK